TKPPGPSTACPRSRLRHPNDPAPSAPRRKITELICQCPPGLAAAGFTRTMSRVIMRTAIVAALTLAGALLAHAQAPEVVFDLKIEKGQIGRASCRERGEFSG